MSLLINWLINKIGNTKYASNFDFSLSSIILCTDRQPRNFMLHKFTHKFDNK